MDHAEVLSTAKQVNDDRRWVALVAVIIAVLVVAILAGLGYLSFEQRRELLAGTAQNAENLARITEEHARGSIDAVDVTLSSVARAMQILPGRDTPRDPEIHALLRANLEHLPHVRAIWILAADGTMIHDSDNLPGTYNLSDRAYFKVQRDDPAQGMYVDPPIISRLGVWFMGTSRRINKPDGSFGGIVAAAVEPQYFEKLYGSLDLGKLGTLSVLRPDGTLIVQAPAFKEGQGKIAAPTPGFVARLAQEQSGEFRQRAGQDGVDRLYAYRKVAGRPLVVMVGLNESESLAGWRAAARANVTAALLMCALLIWLGWRVLRELSRRAALNDMLTETAQRLNLAATSGKVGLWDWNLQSNQVHYSSEWKRQLGYDDDEITDNFEEWRSRVHPDDLDSATETAQAYVAKPWPNYQILLRLRHKNGSYRHILAHASMVMDANGKPVHMMGSHIDVTDRVDAEQALQSSEQSLRALLQRLQHAQEEERIRVAREVHDELGQQLTGLKMDLSWIEGKLSAQEVDPALNPVLERVVAATALNEQTLLTVRRLAAELRPGALDQLGLPAALAQRIRQFSERNDIDGHLDCPDDLPRLPAEMATELFYICQEALTNVVRHAQAQHVHVRLTATDQEVTLEVEDDGVGAAKGGAFDLDSLGLLGMRERARHCRGTLALESVQPHGVRVVARIPMPGAPSLLDPGVG